MLDKKIIQKNFSRGAKSYDEAASIQKKTAKKLCDLVVSHQSSVDCQLSTVDFLKILDLGSGTSFIAKNFSDKKNLKIFEIDLSFEMLKSWTQRPENIFPIQSDFEKLPFKHSSFDAIISSFSLQWMSDFEKNFSEIFSLLKPGGIFAFCLPTEGSLKELSAAKIFHFNQFPKVEDLKSALKKSGFVEKSFSIETLQQSFSNGSAALQSIKKIGANYSQKKNNEKKKIITKAELKQFNNFCLKNFSTTDKNITVSWFTSYFILSK